MTPAEYGALVRRFHQQHQALLKQIDASGIWLAAKKRGITLSEPPPPPLNELVEEHRSLLQTMLDLTKDVEIDA